MRERTITYVGVFIAALLSTMLVLGFTARAYADELNLDVQSAEAQNKIASETADQTPDANTTTDTAQADTYLSDSDDTIGSDTNSIDNAKVGENQTPTTENSSLPDVGSLSGIAHVQDKGDLNSSSSAGEVMTLGTTGQAKRLEGISVNGTTDLGGISYAVHIQNYGWMDETSNGEFAGTRGQSLRLEAATFSIADSNYSIWYRAHVANIGWLGWAKDGAKAGSESMSKRAEALQIVILPTGLVPSGYDPEQEAFLRKVIIYSAHVQDKGDISGYATSLDTVTIGTTGQAKRLEGFRVELADGSITYSAHVQNIGWQSDKLDGEFAGTKGASKRVEAVNFSLTGSIADLFDIYYRAHIANIGWLDWTKGGMNAGTVSFGVPAEAIQLKFVKKGNSAPSTSGISYIDSSLIPVFTCESQPSGSDWSSVSSANIAGTTGQTKSLMGLSIAAESSNVIAGGITYLAHFANTGWTSWLSDGQRDTNAANPIQALKVKLTGELARYFDVYYRSHVANYGWMGWSNNGAPSGTTGLNMNAEAYQIKITLKGAAAPGSTAHSFSDENGFLGMPADQRAMLNRIMGYGSGTDYLIAVDRDAHKVGVFSGYAGNWKLQHYWGCVTGAPETPTITGAYTISGYKMPHLTVDYRAIYCTQISGGYFFHSVLASENEIGLSDSHGCIRLTYAASKWIYDNIWGGTVVVIYN